MQVVPRLISQCTFSMVSGASEDGFINNCIGHCQFFLSQRLAVISTMNLPVFEWCNSVVHTSIVYDTPVTHCGN